MIFGWELMLFLCFLLSLFLKFFICFWQEFQFLRPRQVPGIGAGDKPNAEGKEGTRFFHEFGHQGTPFDDLFRSDEQHEDVLVDSGVSQRDTFVSADVDDFSFQFDRTGIKHRPAATMTCWTNSSRSVSTRPVKNGEFRRNSTWILFSAPRIYRNSLEFIVKLQILHIIFL